MQRCIGWQPLQNSYCPIYSICIYRFSGSCSTIICAIMKKGDRRYQSQKIAQHIKNKTHEKHHEENQRIRAVWTVQWSLRRINSRDSDSNNPSAPLNVAFLWKSPAQLCLRTFSCSLDAGVVVAWVACVVVVEVVSGGEPSGEFHSSSNFFCNGVSGILDKLKGIQS